VPDDSAVRPPFSCRLLILVASWIVPRSARPGWRRNWDSGLWNWWILVERGELTSRAHPLILRHFWGAFRDALWLRFNRQRLRYVLRGPGLVPATSAAVLVLTAALTHGFHYTRNLIEVARTIDQPRPHSGLYDLRENLLMAHAVPLVFALATGIVLLVISRFSLHRYGWRYWMYLIAKTLSVIVILPLLWIEGGAALRANLPNAGLRVFAGGLGFTFLFIAAFEVALVWCLADQRRRCPVCLQLLALPVSMGSWASVLEPATTESLCEMGHGSLSVPEAGMDATDRWIAMDASWRELFETTTGVRHG
jgi:hypothetical protein